MANNDPDHTRPRYSPIEHRAIHERLHGALDELLADYLRHHPKKLPSMVTVEDLIQWSYRQTINPDEVE